MSTAEFRAIINASQSERTDLFLTTANRLGVPLINVEKDFWVCWTLNLLYHRLPPGGPRLLFKGGTSLSKAYGLINRFSEDIDITVFREDLGHTASPTELVKLSNKKRKAALDAITDSCRAYITVDLLNAVSDILNADTDGTGRVEIDESDVSQQTLLVWYPRVDASDTDYMQAAIKIECGAKSALDPNQPRMIKPYIADDIRSIELVVPNVTTINSERTFWDKIVIAHGLRSWFERRGELRQEGQRISRHYYDLHCLMQTESARDAALNIDLGRDCVEHARIFFDRPDYDLASAVPGAFVISPIGDMKTRLIRDYANTEAMIFGDAPAFDDILESITELEKLLNS